MTRLTANAREQLRWAGITQRQWARRFFSDDQWHGDVCGCPDDRCIGYHHDEQDDCGCLQALLADRNDESGGGR